MPTTIDLGKTLEVHSGKFTVDRARDRTSYYEVEYRHESTLEVQENNTRARRVYEQAGFSQAVYGDTTGGSLFYTKPLASE